MYALDRTAPEDREDLDEALGLLPRVNAIERKRDALAGFGGDIEIEEG